MSNELDKLNACNKAYLSFYNRFKEDIGFGVVQNKPVGTSKYGVLCQITVVSNDSKKYYSSQYVKHPDHEIGYAEMNSGKDTSFKESERFIDYTYVVKEENTNGG
jgi:predicted nucleotidyltransferase component of viral defense system